MSARARACARGRFGPPVGTDRTAKCREHRTLPLPTGVAVRALDDPSLSTLYHDSRVPAAPVLCGPGKTVAVGRAVHEPHLDPMALHRATSRAAFRIQLFRHVAGSIARAYNMQHATRSIGSAVYASIKSRVPAAQPLAVRAMWCMTCCVAKQHAQPCDCARPPCSHSAIVRGHRAATVQRHRWRRLTFGGRRTAVVSRTHGRFSA